MNPLVADNKPNEVENTNNNLNVDPNIDSNLIQTKSDTILNQNTENEPQEDPNYKAFREGRKKDREARKEAERKAAEKEAEIIALKAAMEAAFSKSSPTPEAYQQYYGINQGYDQTEQTEEERLEKKLNELLKKREQQSQAEQEERERREYPNRLASNYPDFHHVCSQENLDYLDYHYPELSRPLQRLPEGYDKWSDIYNAVKKFIPNHASAKKEAMRAEMNMQKPKSISSTMSTPTGGHVRESWQEVEQRRVANWERMQRTLKGV
jgi:hypothetical protein